MLYTPFEFENENADLVVVGLTPGPEQQEESYSAAQSLMTAGMPALELLSEIARQGAFSRGLRPRLLSMMKHVGIHEKLGVPQPGDLWTSAWHRFHATSVLPNGIFHRTKTTKRGKKIRPQLFSGTFRKILKHPLMRAEYENRFLVRLSKVKKSARIVACGPEVRRALEHAAAEGAISLSQILGTIPHPSPGSGSQVEIFTGELDRAALKERNPVHNRLRRMDAEKEELLNRLALWRN